MVENVITLLIYIVLLVGLVYLAVFVMGRLNWAIPGQLMNIVWLVVGLIIILLCWRALSPFIGGGGMFPR